MWPHCESAKSDRANAKAARAAASARPVSRLASAYVAPRLATTITITTTPVAIVQLPPNRCTTPQTRPSGITGSEYVSVLWCGQKIGASKTPLG